jgi:hypothetical protein
MRLVRFPAAPLEKGGPEQGFVFPCLPDINGPSTSASQVSNDIGVESAAAIIQRARSRRYDHRSTNASRQPSARSWRQARNDISSRLLHYPR